MAKKGKAFTVGNFQLFRNSVTRQYIIHDKVKGVFLNNFSRRQDAVARMVSLSRRDKRQVKK